MENVFDIGWTTHNNNLLVFFRSSFFISFYKGVNSDYTKYITNYYFTRQHFYHRLIFFFLSRSRPKKHKSPRYIFHTSGASI